MRFAVAKTAITPAMPVFLAGFASRDYKSAQVHDPIHVKTVLLEANKRLLILAFDLIGGDRNFIKSLKGALFRHFGFGADEVLINFSHTHCSLYVTGDDPDLSLRRGYYSIDQEKWPEKQHELDYAPDIAYYRFVEQAVVRSVARCLEELAEGELELAAGSSDVGVCRRLVQDGAVLWGPDPDAATDKALTVLRLSDTQGRCKGLLFSYGCHPTSIVSESLSAEFVGAACAVLEERYPGCTAVFLQGCGGEIVAAKTFGNGGKARGFAEMQEIGDDLAGDVCRIAGNAVFRKIRCAFHTRLDEVKLYTQPTPLAAFTSVMLSPGSSEYQKQNAARVIEAVDTGSALQHLPMYIAVWELDADTRLVALEGEIPSGYGLMTKALFPRTDTIVLGYTNGVFTYVPTRRILDEGGYEAEAYMYHGFRGPFVPEIEDIILGRIVRMQASDEAWAKREPEGRRNV